MKKLLLATIAAVGILAAMPAQATPFLFGNGNGYAAIGGGIAIPQNTDVTLTGPIAASGKIHYKDGAEINAMLGYHFTDYLAGEAEVAYSRVSLDNISGTFGGVSGSLDAGGHASAFIGLVNGIVTPFHGLGFTPYVGGGIGAAHTKSEITSLAGVALGGSSSSDTDFAADGLVGFDIPVAAGFSLGGRYQYLWINSKQTTTSGTETEKDGNFGASVITAQATFHF
jgi:opacity protein-like surface antigen